MKHVDMIVHHIMHHITAQDLVSKLARLDVLHVEETVMRALLVVIAHNGSLATVNKALSAVGAPATEIEITQRIQEAGDLSRAEAGA